MQLKDVKLIEETVPEDVKQVLRMGPNILTEENLARILSTETTKLNLENNYHISNGFIGKIGNVAPNIENLCLRRMPNIGNDVFSRLFTTFENLVTVDLSDCTGLEPFGLQLMLKKNQQLENLQLSGCSDAVDDVALNMISNLENLCFLDLSFCKRFTDRGCNHFQNK